MILRRKSTYAFARKYVGQIPAIGETLDLPMVKPIMDAIDQKRGARFIIRATNQVFKTLIGQLSAMRSALVAPGSAAWYSHPEKAIDDFADEKFNPLFDAIPVLQPILSTDSNKRARTRYVYPGGYTFLLLSAKVQQNRQSKTIRDLYLDELWTYDPGWISEISKRRSSFDEPQTWREILMTAGTIHGTEADQIWEDSDQAIWHCRCPKCQNYFEPRRTHKNPTTGEITGGLMFDTVLTAEGKPDKSAIADSVRYQCPHCKETFRDTPANRKEFNGTVDKPHGAYFSQNPKPSKAPRTFGWQCGAVALKPWAAIALQMVLADLGRKRGDLTAMENLIRQEDASTWNSDQYLRPLEQKQFFGGYKMGDAWANELLDENGKPFRFAKIDAQIDHFWLVIRSWGRFSQSRLRFTARCLSPSEISQHLLAHGVPPERAFIDTRYDTQRVRTIAARMGWRTMMGDRNMRDYQHADGIRRIFDEPKVIDAFTGTIHQGQNTGGYVVEILFSKNSALNRLHVLRSPESVAPDGTPLWTHADDVPDWYLKQINAHFRKRVDNPDGSHHFVWHGQKDDHADDCEAMGIVIASMANLTGAESLEAPPEAKAA